MGGEYSILKKSAALCILACSWLVCVNAFAHTPIIAAYGAMTLDNGYRLTLRHDGETLKAAWRPYGDGAPPTGIRPIDDTQVTAKTGDGLILPLPGSQAAVLDARAHIAIALDTRGTARLFDQLAAIRIMLAAADFDRQSWHFYDAADQARTLTVIASDADLQAGWSQLRSLLAAPRETAAPKSLALIVQQLASLPGDRKALALPETLMPNLKPGLTPQGIAGLQAFGISLYPMTGTLEPIMRGAYITLAKATGGHLLDWLDVPPDAASAGAAFAALSAGGTAAFAIPPQPWQPWQTPPPMDVTLLQDAAPKMRALVPRPAGAWSDLPWPGIAALTALFLACGIAAIVWLRRQNEEPLRITLTDMNTKRSYEITRWPATLGRAERADITIANAHLAPMHVRFSDNGTGIDVKALDETAMLSVAGKDVSAHAFYQDGEFKLAGAGFQITFLSGLGRA